MEDINMLKKGLESLDINLSKKQIEQFMNYYHLLIEWNEFMNLTAITEFEDVVYKHFVDSISLIKELNLNENISIIDVGTGAGFPGIPLKIVYENLEIILLDSLSKRVKFLNEVIDKLQLKNIKAVHNRAEELGRNPEYREKFDLCVSRAVSKLSTLTEYSMPFIKVGGLFISYKSSEIDDELKDSMNSINALGGKLKKVSNFRLWNNEIERTLVIIEKVKLSPKKYPRKAGTPSKEPIR